MGMARRCVVLPSILYVALSTLTTVLAADCGMQADDKLCPDRQCCSMWGYCGTTDAFCGGGCQSQCPSPPSPLESLLSEDLFNEMLLHRNDTQCPARNFYTYGAFIEASKSFPSFAANGDEDTRKREIAAFLAQTSHETTGGWKGAPDGPLAWGYCYKEAVGQTADYCVPNNQWPCAPGKKYFGRGPIQISYNYYYGPAGEALGVDLLNNPELVATNQLISFKTAFWFWMTPQPTKPSCHDVITGDWTPSPADVAARRFPGLGTTTNIINGGVECGHGSDTRMQNRIGFYLRYCDLLGVTLGDNLDCGAQIPFGSGSYAEA